MKSAAAEPARCERCNNAFPRVEVFWDPKRGFRILCSPCTDHLRETTQLHPVTQDAADL